MPTEASGDQPGHPQDRSSNLEQRNDVSKELTIYIDRQMLVPLKERASMFAEHRARGSVATQNINIDNEGHTEEEYLPRDIARFERMRKEVQEGNFSGIAAELQARRAEPEASLTELRPQLRPPGQMYQDEEYFALKKAILAGEQIRDKVKGVLDASELEWVRESIDLRQQKQGETERGRLMSAINKEQQTLNGITHLQQLISQPPQS